MSSEELQVECRRLRDRLYELKSQAITQKLDNPRELTAIKRNIARILTESHVRVNQGVKA